MSMAHNQVQALWQQFMPRRQEIPEKIEGQYYSINVYSENFQMKDFTPQTEFERWAAIAVTEVVELPNGMDTITLSGKYAVFQHKGPASTFPKTLQYIHGVWLPASEYELDDRPHFEILGEGYVPTDPNAEEEVWIPIK